VQLTRTVGTAHWRYARSFYSCGWSPLAGCSRPARQGDWLHPDFDEDDKDNDFDYQ
jgi:hypothetical protein